MTAAVELNELGVRYRERFALRNVNLTIEQGTALGIIGTNGSGKSTLLKAVAGLLPAAHGSVRVFGVAPRRNVAGTIAYVPQSEHVDWNFPATVHDVVAMGRFCRLAFYQPFRKEDTRLVQESLEALGIEELRDRQISALSGGQQQRVFLARALAQEPRVLLLDEPTTGVDTETEEALRIVVRGLVATGRTILMSTHDVERMRDWFDHVIILDGAIVAEGSPDVIQANEFTIAAPHAHAHLRSHPHA